MTELFQNSVYFGVLISILSYELGMILKKKLKTGLCNPMLIAIAVTIIVLLVCDISYDTYSEGSKYLTYLLTPATVCLAIPLYEQIEVLKHHWKAIFLGIVSGVLTSLLSILAMALLFQFTHEEYVTMLPKSITTAIGMGVSEELGGYVSITVAVIAITGVTGNILAEYVLKLFRITEPIAKGIAIGSASHAMGTAKAMEFGKVEGAMSSLSIVLSGMITVVGAMIFANFI